MQIPVFHRRGCRRLAALGFALGIVGLAKQSTLAQDTASAPPSLVTNILQLQQLCDDAPGAACAFTLEGNVWWANAAQGKLVLQDASGAEALEMELPQDFPASGARVRIEGKAVLLRRGSAIQIGPKGPVVDNNGIHAMIEKHGAVYLEAGRHPFRLEWFNGQDRSGLEVEYEGPNLSRQRIPAAALFRLQSEATGSTSNFVNGLEVQYYEVPETILPNFAGLPGIKRGFASNFELNDLPHPERIGAQFSGFIEAPRAGLYTFHLKSDDGSRLYVGRPSFRVTRMDATDYPKPERISVGQILAPEEAGQWTEVEGKVTLVRRDPDGLKLELTAGAGHMLLEMGNDSGLRAEALLNARIRATGFCQSVHTTDGQMVAGNLLVPGAGQIEVLEPALSPDTSAVVSSNFNSLPVLTTAAEVHRLKREEAERAYPVKIRGVVTSVLPEHQAFTLQDATRGIYVVDFTASRPDAPRIGEYLEVEGATDPGLFAPLVNARRVGSQGAGRLPESVKPTWDQLVNGSLDAQQVELEGIVTAIHTNGLTLLTRGGVIKVELRLAGQTDSNLAQYENARVRIRGCLFASWDYVTHQVKMGDVRIYTADIRVVQPAPEDLFSSPRKTAGELLLFDPQASVFQRVKVSGQIVLQHDGEYFLMDGQRGLRFIPKQPVTLETGDTVDVVGFPDLLGSASPVLREAVVRRSGHAALPAARTLTAENLISADHDATRVKVEGRLVSLRTAKPMTILEMQNGVRTFVARLTDADESVRSLTPGSRLELTGIYAGLGGNRAGGQDITSFELLLHSGADINVLARPPWWTLKRLLFMVGALACVLAGAVSWIKQLHRQVAERTAELGAQIQERQRVEHQRAMEAERTRIAQDLHDELGSGITEMSMLAARAKSASAPDEKRGRHLDHVGHKARELVTALDEIVWAMNPRHDSLSSLVSYFSLYADRFLGLANIAWRLEDPVAQSDQVVDSRRRHQLFLAFKEALTNIVRHSGATEVRISLHCEGNLLKMAIVDNGRGLPVGVRTEDMDGVGNMRARIEKLGGQFEIHGEYGHGTTVRFAVPSEYE